MAVWNSSFEATPAGTENPSFGDDRIRELKSAVRERLEKELVMDLTGGDAATDGWFRAGAAKVYNGSSAPTTRPDGVTALTADDNGRVWRRSTDGLLHVYVHGTGWVAIATTAATADRIVQRDSAGRAKVAAPATADDIAVKQTVDDHAALTSPHSATAAATADRLVLRDASGRAAFATPSASNDAATKGYVDGGLVIGLAKVNVTSNTTTTMTAMSVGQTVIQAFGITSTGAEVQHTIRTPPGGTYAVVGIGTSAQGNSSFSSASVAGSTVIFSINSGTAASAIVICRRLT